MTKPTAEATNHSSVLNLNDSNHREQFYQKLIFELSIRFINIPLDQVSNAIHFALEKVAQFFQADRAYIFDYNFEAETTSNTYEWCAQGILPQIQELQNVPLELVPDWVETHLRGEPLIIDDVSTLPEGSLKDILAPQQIKSLIAFPLVQQEICYGFVGLDSVNNYTEYGNFEVQLMSLFSELLASVKARDDYAKRLLQAASVFEHAYEGIVITDPEGRIENVNKAFEHITGLERTQVVGKFFYGLTWATDVMMEKEVIWASLKNLGFWFGEVKKQHPDGSEYILQFNISSVKDNHGTLLHYVALFTEVVEVTHPQNHVKLTSHYDPLTQLPNRLMLTEQLGSALMLANENASLIGVVYIDLDDFKDINDSHSHAAGNEVLLRVTKRLKRVMSEKDLLARLGGDEFVFIVNEANTKREIDQKIELILTELGPPLRLEGATEVQLSASIGVAVFPQKDEVDPDQLIRQADQAMFMAKQAGKNRVQYFDLELDQTIRGRYQNIARMKAGLVNEEFKLYYQPKINMRKGQVCGFEALIRWQHPTQGTLPPDHFLPMIDGHIFSIELGEWVISKALEQIEQLAHYGLELPISVNIDAIHIQHPDFIERLKYQLYSHPHVKPSLLELEILERAALGDIVQVSSVIEACKKLGVSIALDDFGTGYSSLTYLKRLKANTLKIDKSFVRDMLTDPDDLAILEGVIGLANAFQRKVVAEGVETELHTNMLLRLGCEVGQGYVFARPMPASELIGWLQAWNEKHIDYRSVTPISNDKLPVLYAVVEQRSWVKKIKLFAQDFIDDIPPLDCHQCNFGKWLDSETGGGLYASLPLYSTISELHHQMHDQAIKIVNLKLHDQMKQAIKLFTQLDAIQDQLTQALYDLADQT